MKTYLKNHLIIAVIIAVVLTIATAVSASVFSGRTGIISNAVNIILTPIRRGVSGFAGWLGSTYDYIYEFDSLKKENEQLKKQIAATEEQLRESIKDSEENVRLRSLLELKQKRKDFDFESATVIEWGVSNWSSDFTVSKGDMQGVKVNDCVITETGYLIGVVSQVGANWAKVTTVIDTGTEIGAMVSRTGELAIAEGDFKYMRENQLKLTFMDPKSELVNGDVILTSGKGGIFPPGLVIGKVEDVKTDNSGMYKFAVISPAADFDSLKQVFIIKSFELVE